MKYLNALLTAALLCAPAVLATPKPVCNSDNPFLNRVQYVNEFWAGKLDATVASFLAKGDVDNAARVRTVQKEISTFIWVSKTSDIDLLKLRLDEAIKTQRRPPNKKLIFPLVIYNLPDRDCSARASDGEFKLSEGGMTKYKKFVDDVVKEITRQPYDRLDFAIVIEPDSLGNMVTNLSVPKCAGAADAYRDGIAYVINKLGSYKNIALYIDAAHSNWLGWPDNLEPATKEFAEVLRRAGPGKKIRGFATNVSNYNGYNPSTPDIIYGPGPDNANWSELRYAKALAPVLKRYGLPAHFIIDQGRSGQQNIRLQGGHWCNIADSGFGIPPTTETGECIVDALVWVKPGGESDGTSDPSAVRFDENCRSPDAFVPSPEAGDWHNDFVEMLIKNANPPIEPTYDF